MGTETKAVTRLPTIYLPHGGGPWHVMQDAMGGRETWLGLEAWLQALGARYRGRVKALLVISAHWEENQPTILDAANPGMLYDYSGFPAHTYQLQWPAPGDPALAERVAGLLQAAGIKTGSASARGYDHGTFVPLMVAFPQADIPVVQLSLVKGLDPATHFRIGEALQPLRDEGVLIIGSGMSYHNMRGFGHRSSGPTSELFDDWLKQTVEQKDAAARERGLIAWESAPAARECHPRSEHLVPLFVVAGAGGADPGIQDFSGKLMDVAVSAFRFGDA